MLHLRNMNVIDNAQFFGVTLDRDREDCIVGQIVLLNNGRFKISKRELTDSGQLNLVLERDKSTRRQRRIAKKRL